MCIELEVIEINNNDTYVRAMRESAGIILKTCLPSKCKVFVLDRQLGKIVCVPNRKFLPAGSLLNYWTYLRNDMYFMRDIEIIDMPLLLAREDILFFHHILELCYFSIPLHSCDSGVFELLSLIYATPNLFTVALTKKLFLFKLFMLLGIHPEEQKFHSSRLLRFSAESIDTIASQSIELELEKELDGWLFSCISVHPYVENFKTIHFLNKNRIA